MTGKNDEWRKSTSGVQGRSPGEIHEGDEVELFGKNIPVTEVAEKAGTIAWEIFTGITPRVVRCYHSG